MIWANRIAVGTANFAKSYNGYQVPKEEVEKILEYCKQVGIDMLDTATTYGTENLGGDDFKRIVKIKPGSSYVDCNAYSVLVHDNICKSVSGNLVVEVPYSIYDRRYEQDIIDWTYKGYEIFVRSIYLKGTLLNNYAPQECIMFCLMNPHVNRIVLGVDSKSQLEASLGFLERWDSPKTDEEVIDTRRF